MRNSAVGPLFLAMLTCRSHSQWTVTNLHPPGATSSRAHGVSGIQQVGIATIGGASHASLWTETAESWIDLHPAGAIKSECWDVDRGHQVGAAYYATNTPSAALWSSTRDSYSNLNPPNAAASILWGVDGDTQAGSVRFDTPGSHAATWKSTPESVVDLHGSPPPSLNIRQTEFFGIRDGEMVGYTLITSLDCRGMICTGTELDAVPMPPTTPPTLCNVDMTSKGQHVGYISSRFATPKKAMLWAGSPLVPIDLTPPGAQDSWAQGIWRGQQVGYSRQNQGSRAILWNGSPTSTTDLHTFLPNGFTSSNARGIWSDYSMTYVVGWGVNSTNGRTEAILWSRQSCWPDLTHNEVVDDDDFAQFIIAYDTMICPEKLCLSDFNDDGLVDDADFQLFVVAYDALLCP